jgi:hypothetical protein
MRSVKTVALVAVCVLALGALLFATQNKFGVADTQTVTFDEPIRVGTVVLPKGEYRVTHTMEGEEHIMVFTQLRVKEPVEARVKCTLVPLPTKAERTEKFYTHDANNQHVLEELTFRGDSAKHVF